MASRGWIKLYRSIRDHYLWDEKPFSRLQAWLDLLLTASHEDSKFLLGGSLIETKAGDIVTSEQKLMERWGWSKTKTRKFLSLLESDHMIEKKADRKKTTISIVNWGKFQNQGTTEEPQKDHRETTEEPQKDSYKNIEECNKNVEEGRERLQRHKYGQYKNVLLSDEEMQKLQSEFPDLSERIERLSEYLETSGKKYKSHSAVIRSWARKDKEKGKVQDAVKRTTNRFVNYEQSVTDWDLVADRIMETQERECEV